jgi:hypothetical protein
MMKKKKEKENQNEFARLFFQTLSRDKTRAFFKI